MNDVGCLMLKVEGWWLKIQGWKLKISGRHWTITKNEDESKKKKNIYS